MKEKSPFLDPNFDVKDTHSLYNKSDTFHSLFHLPTNYKSSEYIKSMEYLEPLNDSIIKEFNTAWQNNEELEKILYTEIKDTKFKYLVDEDEFIIIKKKKYYLKNATLYDFIEYTFKNKNFKPYFIRDDKKDTFIGFIAYYEEEDDPEIVDGIKLFKFDEKGSVTKDVVELINNLLRTHKSVSWEAHIENNVINSYDIYLLRKQREGYVTIREKDKENKNIMKYTIKQKE